MSVRVMSEVWTLDLPDSQKIVLLALADAANDEGVCWPSIASLVKKTSKGERTVQGVIKQLCEGGHLTREERVGKGCLYTVHPRSGCAQQAVRPAVTAPPQGTTVTPAAAADKPSRTIINGLSNDKPKRPRKGTPAKPDEVEPQVWSDFLALRQRKRAPLTDTALDGIRREAAKARWGLNEALTEAVTRGWQSFKADWIKPDEPKFRNSQQSSPRQRDGVAAALDRRLGFDGFAGSPDRRAIGDGGGDGGGTIAYLAAVR